MADYTPLLTRAVAGQDEAARTGIYARAREALERQLRAFEPKLEEAQIRAEIEGLEKAIASVEASVTAVAEVAELVVTPEPVTVPEVAEPASPPEPEAEPAPEPAAQETAPEPPVASEPEPAAPPVEEPAETPVDEVPAVEAQVAPPLPLESEAPAAAGLTAAEPEAEPEGPSTTTPLDEASVLTNDSTADVTAPALSEPVIPPVARPRMPLRHEGKTSRKPLAFAGLGALVVMLGIGALALAKRGSQDPLRNPQAPQQQVSSAEASKTEGRLASEAPARPVERPVETAPATPDTAQKPATAPQPPAAEQPVSTSTRAFMVLESPGNAPSQFEGAAIWSFEADSANKGQKALRLLVAFPGADVTVDLTLSRNTDKAIAASHLMMAIFETPKGTDPVRELSPLEWRERESTQGSVLRGSVVPVQDNVFMVTLDKAAEAANLDLMLRQKWIVFEFRLANGRRGAVLVEKGANGDRAVAEAITTWK